MGWLSFAGFVDAIKESTDDRMVAHVKCPWTGQLFRVYIPDGIAVARKSNIVISGDVSDDADFNEILEIASLDIAPAADMDNVVELGSMEVIDSIEADIADKDGLVNAAPVKPPQKVAVEAIVSEVAPKTKQEDNKTANSIKVPPHAPEAKSVKTEPAHQEIEASPKKMEMEPVDDALVALTRDELFTEKDPVDLRKEAEELAKLSLYRDKTAMFAAGQVFTLYGDEIDDEIVDMRNAETNNRSNDNGKRSISGAPIAAITFQELMRGTK